ncbi:MAG: VWA domain-containing protein [Mycobacterium sp.]
MTFVPALPWPWLLAIGAILMATRMIALQRILSRTGTHKAVLRWAGLTLALLCVLVAAARPGFDTGRDTALTVQSGDSSSGDLNVLLVVDRSAGAPVADMRADVEAIISGYPDARFALISFATRATLDWPLSDDTSSLTSVVAGLQPYAAAVGAGAQANAFAARDVLYAKAESALAEYPGSRNLVFYLGAGTPDSVVARGEFALPAGAVTDGAVLGYRNGAGDLDESRLRQIADQLGVPYTLRQNGQPVDSALPAPDVAAGVSGEAVEVTERRELYWLFALLAAGLMLVEMTLTLREYRRTRSTRRDVLL